MKEVSHNFLWCFRIKALVGRWLGHHGYEEEATVWSPDMNTFKGGVPVERMRKLRNWNQRPKNRFLTFSLIVSYVCDDKESSSFFSKATQGLSAPASAACKSCRASGQNTKLQIKQGKWCECRDYVKTKNNLFIQKVSFLNPENPKTFVFKVFKDNLTIFVHFC